MINGARHETYEGLYPIMRTFQPLELAISAGTSD